MAQLGTTSFEELDNFYVVEEGFEFEGKIWHSSEALYQALKYVDKDYQEAIRTATVQKAWSMGHSTQHKTIKRLRRRRPELMYIANKAKFSVPRLQHVLLSTRRRKIAFNKSSTFWNKENARILMSIRDCILEN